MPTTNLVNQSGKKWPSLTVLINMDDHEMLLLFSSESMFFLRVKDKMAALYPSVGIVVELIVLVVIIFACEKAKGPSSSGEDDDEYNGNAVGRSDSSVRHRRT